MTDAETPTPLTDAAIRYYGVGGTAAVKPDFARNLERRLAEQVQAALDARMDLSISQTELAAERARGDAAERKADAEMERVKACEHIAEGDDGWEVLRELCPSTSAVARLRDTVTPGLGYSSWKDRAEAAESRAAEMENMVRWSVKHEGECLGDYPHLLEAARAALSARSAP